MEPRSHEEHIRHTFDAFCKKVLWNEARDYIDELTESIAALPAEKHNIILLSYFLELTDKEITQICLGKYIQPVQQRCRLPPSDLDS